MPEPDIMPDPDPTFWDWRHQAQQDAVPAGIEPVEVDGLIRAVTGWTGLDRVLGRTPSAWDQGPLKSLWHLRLTQRIPLQYLVGEVVWRDLQLQVTPSVLIPRPETELLVDLSLEWLGQTPAGFWVDLGTGSGAIALGLAQAHAEMRVYAVDLSPDALAVATANRDRYGWHDRIQMRLGRWFDPLGDLKGRIQGMVSNPPYIPSVILPTLQPEVRDHEPWLALDGGSSGLEAFDLLVRQAPDYLQPGGFWLVEVMQGQAPDVKALLERDGRYGQIQLHTDLAGIERAVSAELQGSS